MDANVAFFWHSSTGEAELQSVEQLEPETGASAAADQQLASTVALQGWGRAGSVLVVQPEGSRLRFGKGGEMGLQSLVSSCEVAGCRPNSS